MEVRSKKQNIILFNKKNCLIKKKSTTILNISILYEKYT